MSALDSKLDGLGMIDDFNVVLANLKRFYWIRGGAFKYL